MVSVAHYAAHTLKEWRCTLPQSSGFTAVYVEQIKEGAIAFRAGTTASHEQLAASVYLPCR